MKLIEIKGQYIVNADLKQMLEKTIEHISKSCIEQSFEIGSNIGGNLVCEIKDVPIEDLREKYNKQ